MKMRRKYKRFAAHFYDWNNRLNFEFYKLKAYIFLRQALNLFSREGGRTE